MELIKRPRRLRGGANLRKMVRETRMDKSSLIYPLFVMEGNGIQEEIPPWKGSTVTAWTVFPIAGAVGKSRGKQHYAFWNPGS